MQMKKLGNMINILNYVILKRNLLYGTLLPLKNVPCVGNVNQITLDKLSKYWVTVDLDLGYD